MQDIRKNVLPKFMRLCLETPCWCPFVKGTNMTARMRLDRTINKSVLWISFPFSFSFLSEKDCHLRCRFPGQSIHIPLPPGLWTLSSPLWLWQGSTPLSIVLVHLFLCIKKSVLWIKPPFLLSSFLILATTWGARFTLWKVKNSTPSPLQLRL